ncbi:MAG TPA: hypothetical protein VM368_08275 [Flavisolibacter sp.]|nr:hypothetical protein [Flavisolibacter sp.]
MKIKFSLLLLLSVLTTTLNAQDPWIVKAYRQIYGKTNLTMAEVNIRNYNNGSWNSYCELVSHIVGYNNSRGSAKGDPWIFRVYCELYSEKIPSSDELNIRNYNNGSWNNYAELKRYVQAYNSPPVVVTGKFKGGKYDGKPALAVLDKGTVKAVNLIGPDGATLIGPDGGSIIGNDAGSLISNGTSIIGNDAGSFVVTKGAGVVMEGGPLRLISNTPSLRLISNYELQSVSGAKSTNWGQYKIVIR